MNIVFYMHKLCMDVSEVHVNKQYRNTGKSNNLQL